ncbi:hypothetical protein [Paenibacillus cremeus]|uniref:Aldolase n=1 Tax=Paenibacillus cremeus TaxID=2163881 RepID=A0A559K0P8_9BACL|nr:hypothetical protein [Paenibacillus cremeus]TVY05620.1 hypothetical protein FPZ49_29015 [Paenibacillus cremeus]
MDYIQTQIGEHHIRLENVPESLMKLFLRSYPFYDDPENEPDIVILIEEGYGVPFVDYEVSIKKESDKISFCRADYLIESDRYYKNARIFVHDELALKHALISLYSSYIAYHNWGLLLHSSCVIDNGKAHIFAGHSGAGKSTAARLSYPRTLLSDEATIVKITSDEVTVYNSPFRSEQEPTDLAGCYSLSSIQVLVQALHNQRLRVRKPNGLLELMDKVFYWPHSSEETGNLLGLLNILVNRVPVYELHFQYNNKFWELIS